MTYIDGPITLTSHLCSWVLDHVTRLSGNLQISDKMSVPIDALRIEKTSDVCGARLLVVVRIAPKRPIFAKYIL